MVSSYLPAGPPSGTSLPGETQRASRQAPYYLLPTHCITLDRRLTIAHCQLSSVCCILLNRQILKWCILTAG
jgi:hypothetical protein